MNQATVSRTRLLRSTLESTFWAESSLPLVRREHKSPGPKRHAQDHTSRPASTTGKTNSIAGCLYITAITSERQSAIVTALEMSSCTNRQAGFVRQGRGWGRLLDGLRRACLASSWCLQHCTVAGDAVERKWGRRQDWHSMASIMPSYGQSCSILLNPAQACSVLLNMHHVGSPTAIMGGKT